MVLRKLFDNINQSNTIFIFLENNQPHHILPKSLFQSNLSFPAPTVELFLARKLPDFITPNISWTEIVYNKIVPRILTPADHLGYG